ncbi:MAG TPA: extensin family protein [Bradyrhizobium sp.]|jgi:hypothetical protein|nr:extensin family protein [Bradyrhizobium sp.]
MVTAAVLLLMVCAQPEAAAARRSGAWSQAPWSELVQEARPRQRRAVAFAAVPLPKPRPAEAPAIEDGLAESKPEAAEKPAAEQAAAPKPPSACRLALTEAIAIAPSIAAVSGPGGCGGDDLVRLEAVVLADKKQVAVKPAAILRCTMAAAVADWIRSDMAPFAQRLGRSLSDLDNFASFECRGRNRVLGAKMSEHGRANALDLRALKFADGGSLSLTDRSVAREQREAVLRSVCARFTTVLGPGSDWYHEDHIHLDLAERRGGYRICQWNVYDSLPAIAPLLPAERPEEAPPRQVAAKPDAAKPAAAKPDEPDAEAEPVPAPKPRPTKKRRRTGAS